MAQNLCCVKGMWLKTAVVMCFGPLYLAIVQCKKMLLVDIGKSLLACSWTRDFLWPEFSVWVCGWKWSLQLAIQRMRGMLSWCVYCISFASAYCFLVFVHFSISCKLKSQGKSVSRTSEMFTEILDSPVLFLVWFFLLLFIWYVLYLKGGCVHAMHTVCNTSIA